MRGALIWLGLCLAVTVPLAAAAVSPLLAWRDPVYILGGFAGIVGLALLMVQPMLAAGYLPGVNGRYWHRWVGISLVAAVLIHVGALWVTSPPDVIDALLFVSPTPFAVWGVIAMWAVFLSALLAILRKRLPLRIWRRGHTALAVVIVGTSLLHAVMIEGTMEIISKLVLCGCICVVTTFAVRDLRAWVGRM